jgi:hypothetical protein
MTTETRIGESQIVLSCGTRHVSIWSQDGDVTATKFHGNVDFHQADVSSLRWRGKTVAGARKWAAKVLGA